VFHSGVRMGKRKALESSREEEEYIEHFPSMASLPQKERREIESWPGKYH